MNSRTKVTGVILAGGQARRMNNSDKGLILYRGRPLADYALAALSPVCTQVIISANRNIEKYRQFGLPVVADQRANFDGPLAGILTAMFYAETGVLLVAPCDSPFIKAEHLGKLLTACTTQDADAAVAFDGVRLHPVFLALKTELRSGLQAYLDSGQRKLGSWLQKQKTVNVDFSGEPQIFINLNTMAELQALEENDHS